MQDRDTVRAGFNRLFLAVDTQAPEHVPGVSRNLVLVNPLARPSRMRL